MRPVMRLGVIVLVVCVLAAALAFVAAAVVAGPAEAARRPGSVVWKAVADPTPTVDWLQVCRRGPSGSLIAGGSAGDYPSPALLVASYGAARGNPQWSSLWTGPDAGYSGMRDMAVDGAGNVYVCGFTTTIAGQRDAVILKYDAKGGLVWATVQPFSLRADDARAVKLDAAGNVYVAGTMDTTDPVVETDLYVARFSAATGHLVWHAPYDGGASEAAVGLSVTRNGTCYAAGWSDSVAGQGALLVRTDPGGTVAWGKVWQGPAGGDDWWRSVEPARGGGVIVLGTTDSSGPSDIAVARYTATGGRKWVHTWSSTGSRSDRDGDLAVAADGSVWACGSITPDDESRAVVLKYTPRGKRLFAKTTGTAAAPAVLWALTVDAYGNAYVVGQQKKGESGWDAIAAKYTPLGLRRWTSGVGYGPGSDDEYEAVCLGPAGYLYAVGTVDFMGADPRTLAVKIAR